MIHAKRLNRLMLLVESVLNQGKLALTSLGRHTSGEAQVKNKIKATDRFLGNGHFYSEIPHVYRAMANKIIGTLKEIDIVVDWSSAGSKDHHVLRASVAYAGRCVTIYERVCTEKQVGNYKIHEQFLNALKEIIPPGCHPTIITDAGFRTDWFMLVEKLGWDYVGRNISNMQFTQDGIHWQESKSLYKKATKKPQCIGEVLLSKANKLKCNLYLYKETKRKKTNKKKRKSSPKRSHRQYASTEKMYRKQSFHPWLLVTSKKKGSKSAKKIVRAYKRRMKIEHDFRDTKDMKCGLGLNLILTRDLRRLETMLLIGALSSFMLTLIGLAAENKNLQYQLQANSIKKHRVLSLIFLGMQVIKHCLQRITMSDLEEAMINLQCNEVSFYE
jgi:hypothetical protein